MSQLKIRVHLFNCDNTYKLEPVEKFLDQYSIHVEPEEKHSFRLPEMSEMVDKIPTLEMNMAFFVVNTHESRLSINEDNAGMWLRQDIQSYTASWTGKERKHLHFFFYCIKHIYFSLITRVSASKVLFRKGRGSLVKSYVGMLRIITANCHTLLKLFLFRQCTIHIISSIM